MVPGLGGVAAAERAMILEGRSDSTRPGRLVCIDVLRGVAALAVLLHHIPHQAQDISPRLARYLFLPFDFGYVGVSLFLVLSGFCIHLAGAVASFPKESSGRTGPRSGGDASGGCIHLTWLRSFFPSALPGVRRYPAQTGQFPASDGIWPHTS